ncbi:Bd3614 family nucleic acid deaminase [Pigmentibacter sp. JX0631]|uniref:Bd3614 family nucleic acid deaminase n=1 Tax=Pigmentibacter sp. JX0631 TaxID=2976982 RepID=UPI00246979A9|nr:Bd3614 family nucleic acid deaminase [Pigmentibacter sp. JX0631]WGL60962.1 Bd3614 family nucleic acid deaminase [Pigmentibacter sp. JX0631]
MQNIVPEQILYYLKKQNQTDYAFLVYQNTVYFAQNIVTNDSPLTAVTKLIQGISEQYKDNAHSILRKKIYTSYFPTNKCLGMIKVAAKRFAYLSSSQTNLFPIPFEIIEIKYSIHYEINNDIKEFLHGLMLKNSKECMQAALALKEKVTIKNSLALSDRKIAAILVDENYNVLAYGLNSNAKNRTRHAEIDLIYRFYNQNKKKLPKNSKLFITLKPCIMCSNMITECAEDIVNIKVYYFEKDNGTFSKKTTLDSEIKCSLASKTSSSILEHLYLLN